MRILGISQSDSGCGYHRVILPIGFMDNVQAFVTNKPDEETLAKGWDYILFNRFSPFDGKFDDVRKEMNAKIIMDLDDDWELPSNHINYNEYNTYKARMENNMVQADHITTTNERLANKISKIRKDVTILPNSLPYGLDQFNELKEPSNRLRIFWCGSVTHQRDIAILSNPIKRFNEFGDKIEMVIGGYTDTNEPSRIVWDRMLRYFTNNLSLKFSILKGMRPVNYMALYQHADIMLIPLENSPWHACKSNLKILEAAAKKIPCIVSAVEPYINDQDAPVFWVHKQSDWYKHTKFLINNEKERKEAGERLHEWAIRNYNLLNINNRRAECFANIGKA